LRFCSTPCEHPWQKALSPLHDAAVARILSVNYGIPAELLAKKPSGVSFPQYLHSTSKDATNDPKLSAALNQALSIFYDGKLPGAISQ